MRWRASRLADEAGWVGFELEYGRDDCCRTTSGKAAGEGEERGAGGGAAADDDADPPVRGADVPGIHPAGPADRRVLPSVQRAGGRGGGDRGGLPEGQGLPDQRRIATTGIRWRWGWIRGRRWPSCSAGRPAAPRARAARCTSSRRRSGTSAGTASSAGRSRWGRGRRSPASTRRPAACASRSSAMARSTRACINEALNLASLWKLPCIFIVENNQMAMGTQVERSSAEVDLERRGSGYNMPYRELRRQRPGEVIEVVGEAAERARRGEGPTYLVANTYRFRGHSMSDAMKYRTQGGAGAGAPARSDGAVRAAAARAGHDRR